VGQTCSTLASAPGRIPWGVVTVMRSVGISNFARRSVYNEAMGESEAVGTTYKQDRVTPKRFLKAQQRRLQALDGVLLPIAVAGRTANEVPVIREVWPGKDYELAVKVKSDLTQQKGRAPTPAELTEGFRAACQRYVKENGRSFTVKNLRKGLAQYERRIEEQHYPHLHAKSKKSPHA
jgi:hypothetical protein